AGARPDSFTGPAGVTKRRSSAAGIPNGPKNRSKARCGAFFSMLEPDLIELFVRPLDRIQIRYLVSGSVAAMLYGEPRVTHDIDFVVHLSPRDCDLLADAYPNQEFYVPPAEVIAAELTRPGKGHFNIIHSHSGLKADFYPATRDELDGWAFRNVRQD